MAGLFCSRRISCAMRCANTSSKVRVSTRVMSNVTIES
uniref:Uncharacterized protein n=1 Tax=Arundo donax TaxID=35708 RepID=A0A0A8ZEW1_ARUDO